MKGLICLVVLVDFVTSLQAGHTWPLLIPCLHSGSSSAGAQDFPAITTPPESFFEIVANRPRGRRRSTAISIRSTSISRF